MESHYGIQLVHFFILFGGVCFAVFLVCAYADGDFDRWCDWMVERWHRARVSVWERVK